MQQLLTHEPLGTQTRELLSDLGGTPDEVARYLESLGVRGVRNNSECCAVAEFLAAIVASHPEVRSVRVFRRFVILSRNGPFWLTAVRLPRPVRSFVLAFDAGEYPNLLRSPGPLRRSDASNPPMEEEQRRAP